MKLKNSRFLLILTLLVFVLSPVVSASASTDQPPTVWSTFSCGLPGNNGWCRAPSTLQIFASDPQNYPLSSFTAYRNGVDVSSACNKYIYLCNIWIGEGVWTVNYTATSAFSNLSASESVVVKVDATAPTPTTIVPSPTGSNGWFTTTPINLSISATDDAMGVPGDQVSGVADTWLSIDGGITRQATALSLSSDGKYLISYGADDMADNPAYFIVGRYSFPGIPVNIDTTPPSLNLAALGISGARGWYISPVDVTANASDATSGIASVTYRVDGGAWQSGTSMQVTDGNHTADFLATDNAGNRTSSSMSVKLDTTAPVSIFDGSHTANDVVSGSVTISGSSSDVTSGVQAVQVSTDSGTIWQAASYSNGSWSYPWDTSNLSNGSYTVLVRGIDAAGNIENPAPSLTLVVNNSSTVIVPSSTSTTTAVPSATFTTSPTLLPSASPSSVASPISTSTRRVDPTGTAIQSVSLSTIAQTPSPTASLIASPTLSPTPEVTVTATLMPSPTPTSVQAVVVPTQPVLPVENTAPTLQQLTAGASGALLPILAVLPLISFMWIVSSVSVVDPRPKAILAIVETISKKVICKPSCFSGLN